MELKLILPRKPNPNHNNIIDAYEKGTKQSKLASLYNISLPSIYRIISKGRIELFENDIDIPNNNNKNNDNNNNNKNREFYKMNLNEISDYTENYTEMINLINKCKNLKFKQSEILFLTKILTGKIIF